jgi:hypothetical protein
MNELSVIYSNMSWKSLTYNGKVYDHLRDVVKAKVKDLKEQLDLQENCLPQDEKVFEVEGPNSEHTKRQEQKEESELLNSGVSELSDSLSAWGISFEPVKVPLMITDMSMDLERLVPRLIQLGIDITKLAVKAWGGTRTKNIPDATVLGLFLPVMEPIIGFGEPISYKEYETHSGGLLVTSPSTTFEFWTTLMPIFHVILFCGSLANGDLREGQEIRQGFVRGILPPGPNGVGFLINWEKSVLIPSHSQEFLGFVFNTKKMSISVPVQKLQKLMMRLKQLLNHPLQQQSCRWISSLVGKMMAMIPAIGEALLHLRYM